MRILSILGFVLGFSLSIISARNQNSAVIFILYIIYFIFNASMLCLFSLIQIILVIFRVRTYWPIGNVFLGFLFFSLSFLALIFSNDICELAVHYIDGVFISSILSLLSVMMVYKYWDSITREYLEFCIERGENLWKK
jgi:Chitin synthase export chaperone